MIQAVGMINQQETREQGMFFDEFIQVYMMDTLNKKTFALDESVEIAQFNKTIDNKDLVKLLLYAIKTKSTVNDLSGNQIFDEPMYLKFLRAKSMMISEDVKNQVIKDGTITRNKTWLSKIITKTSEGSCFIAVGLGHLQYKTGLISLLRNEGYRVRPINLKKHKL
jgi:uncharacterized protein YbaP (TraB family)